MTDGRQLAAATTSETMKAILTKYGTRKLSGFINLNKNQIKIFQDTENSFWVR